MNDASEEDIARSSDMEAMRLLAQKFATKSSRSQPVKAERKEKEKKARSVVDGRSLRATGRTAQFNFKCTPEIKALVHETADSESLTVAEWMERAVLAALRGK